MTLPLPIEPFKTAIRRVPGVIEQLSQPTDIALLPGLLGQAHVGPIEMAASFGCFRVCPQALPRLGEPLLLFGIPGPAGLERLPCAHDRSGDEGHRDRRRGRKGQLVSSKRFLKAVSLRGRAGHDRLVGEVPLDVGGEAVGGFVAAGAVLFEALHHDPVEIGGDVRSPALRRLW